MPAYQSIGVGFPCVEVNIAAGLDRGFAVLRAPSSATRVIVIPTTPISGIESPALLRENAPNYWEAAWEARRFVEEGARCQLPRDKIGMAINSAVSRSQNQLHIHVACIARRVHLHLRPVCLAQPVPSQTGLFFAIARIEISGSRCYRFAEDDASHGCEPQGIDQSARSGRLRNSRHIRPFL